MSLLSICQGVARSVKIEVPSSIIGNGSDEASLLLQCAQDEGEALARRPQGGWVQMIKEYDFAIVAYVRNGTLASGTKVITGLSATSDLTALTFGVSGTGVPANTYIQTIDSSSQITLNNAVTVDGVQSLTFGQSDYTMPSDFERPIDGTMWDRTRYWAMRGPMSPQQWQFFKSTPFARATIQRRFRFRKIGTQVRFSIDPVPNDNGTPLVLEYVSNAWCQSASGTPQMAWAADSDVGIIDEYLIRLGVKWRALDRLGMAYDSALAEYEREVDKAIAHDGAAGILNMTPNLGPVLISDFNVQEGNFPSAP